MTSDQIALTALTLGFLGWLSPRTGWVIMGSSGALYLVLGWIPFGK